MKTDLQYLHLNAKTEWHRQVDAQLEHLHSLAAITSARVTLEHQSEVRPAFHVCVRLEVPSSGEHPKATRQVRKAALLIPGPALQAEAHGSTLEAALLKTTRALERQLHAHQLRRHERAKSQLQLSARSGRWTNAQPGRKP